MLTAALLLASFLVGSIPFGLLIGRLGGIDVRTVGSGNIGATNVWRNLGWKFGLPCFILDALKGFAPAFAAGLLLKNGALGPLSPTESVIVWVAAGAAAMLGHIFTPWLKFKGGKGVATGLGAMLGMPPALLIAVLIAVPVWLVCFWRTKIVGISSCFAALSMPVSVLLVPRLVKPASATPEQLGLAAPLTPMLIAAAALAALVVYTHRSNIARTLKGTEHRFSKPASN